MEYSQSTLLNCLLMQFPPLVFWLNAAQCLAVSSLSSALVVIFVNLGSDNPVWNSVSWLKCLIWLNFYARCPSWCNTRHLSRLEIGNRSTLVCDTKQLVYSHTLLNSGQYLRHIWKEISIYLQFINEKERSIWHLIFKDLCCVEVYTIQIQPQKYLLHSYLRINTLLKHQNGN